MVTADLHGGAAGRRTASVLPGAEAQRVNARPAAAPSISLRVTFISFVTFECCYTNRKFFSANAIAVRAASSVVRGVAAGGALDEWRSPCAARPIRSHAMPSAVVHSARCLWAAAMPRSIVGFLETPASAVSAAPVVSGYESPSRPSALLEPWFHPPSAQACTARNSLPDATRLRNPRFSPRLSARSKARMPSEVGVTHADAPGNHGHPSGWGSLSPLRHISNL